MGGLIFTVLKFDGRLGISGLRLQNWWHSMALLQTWQRRIRNVDSTFCIPQNPGFYYSMATTFIFFKSTTHLLQTVIWLFFNLPTPVGNDCTCSTLNKGQHIWLSAQVVDMSEKALESSKLTEISVSNKCCETFFGITEVFQWSSLLQFQHLHCVISC